MCTVGIVGGTGSRPIMRGSRREEHRVATRWGPVDVAVIFGETAVFAYLHRHGMGHTVPPHAIRHEANMAALRAMGVRDLIGINAVGSLRTDLPVGSFVLLDDFIAAQSVPPRDGPTAVRHTDVSRPYCERLRSMIARELAACPGFRSAGVMAGVVGPRFETASEVRMLRQLGADVVGMTGVPEAVAAREAGLCYAAIACVTNLGVGLNPERLRHADVELEMETIVATLVPSLIAVAAALDSSAPCPVCGMGDYCCSGLSSSPTNALNS